MQFSHFTVLVTIDFAVLLKENIAMNTCLADESIEFFELYKMFLKKKRCVENKFASILETPKSNAVNVKAVLCVELKLQKELINFYDCKIWAPVPTLHNFYLKEL